MEEIWRLQSFMIDQAERGGIPVIAVRGADDTVASAMDEVMRHVGARFPANPERGDDWSSGWTPRPLATRGLARASSP
jgi:2-phosphoglycerate kinase